MSHFPQNIRYHGHKPSQISSGLQVTRMAITNTQAKALPGTPIDIVPSPGPTSWLTLISAIVMTNEGFVAYGNVGGGLLRLQYGADASENASKDGNAADMLSRPNPPGADPDFLEIGTLTQYQGSWGRYAAGVVGKPLTLFLDNGGGGSLSGGHADNMLTITVLFAVLNL